jgi:hypothetical protein
MSIWGTDYMSICGTGELSICRTVYMGNWGANPLDKSSFRHIVNSPSLQLLENRREVETKAEAKVEVER